MRQQESMIGNSIALADALEHVSRLAPINRPVLVLGERGTGKELIAQRMHFLSGRWEAPLVKVNCAAMAESLLESELFGHEPGAFTGATGVHHGRFERADGGTLFLDELGTMSLRLQEKLLRLVEYGEFERLGGQQSIRVDVRVVAATHADLRKLVAENNFRADLLDRLSFDVVHLPPLRKRDGDVRELAEHFALAMCAELGWEVFPGFSEAALETLDKHEWPGNIRELKNAVERSLYRWGDASTPVDDIVVDPFRSPFDEPFSYPAPMEQGAGVESSPVTGREAAFTGDFHEYIATIEKQLLRKTLRENRHNQRQAAAALGLSYDQMRGLVRKYQLGGRNS